MGTMVRVSMEHAGNKVLKKIWRGSLAAAIRKIHQVGGVK